MGELVLLFGDFVLLDRVPGGNGGLYGAGLVALTLGGPGGGCSGEGRAIGGRWWGGGVRSHCARGRCQRGGEGGQRPGNLQLWEDSVFAFIISCADRY